MGPVKTILISQARTGSTRLPGKVLLKIGGKELLKIHLDRLAECKMVDHIIVATTSNPNDIIIQNLCEKWNVESFCGSENDVLDRFYQAVKNSKPTWVVRVTSDCPLIDPKLIDALIKCAQVNDVDYCSNVLVENFPDGQDIEVFKFIALEKAWNEAKLNSEREHVTPYIRTHSSFNEGELFSSVNFPCIRNLNHVRMTVDELNDFELMKVLIENLGTKQTWLVYANYILEKGLYKINKDNIRNEGLLKSLRND